MWWIGLGAVLLVIVCSTVWAGVGAGAFVAATLGVQVALFAVVWRADRRAAASIEANVREAVARRDRLLARLDAPRR